jgi:hypothetical protein
MAKKHGIDVDSIIRANRKGECSGTEHEVQMLSRMVDDERISRTDIPKILDKSYRQCFDDGDFDKIKKFTRLGIYSKVSTLLYADKIKNKKRNNKRK